MRVVEVILGSEFRASALGRCDWRVWRLKLHFMVGVQVVFKMFFKVSKGVGLRA